MKALRWPVALALAAWTLRDMSHGGYSPALLALMGPFVFFASYFIGSIALDVSGAVIRGLRRGRGV